MSAITEIANAISIAIVNSEIDAKRVVCLPVKRHYVVVIIHVFGVLGISQTIDTAIPQLLHTNQTVCKGIGNRSTDNAIPLIGIVLTEYDFYLTLHLIVIWRDRYIIENAPD
jgi:hypothetical protein